ncbi:MAG: ATP-binding protein [Bacteroidota bacterium]
MLRSLLACVFGIVLQVCVPCAHAQDNRVAEVYDQLAAPDLADSTVLVLTEEALALAGATSPMRNELLRRRAHALLGLGDSDAALTKAEAAANALAFTDEAGAALSTYALLGRIHQQRGSLAEGVAWLEQGLSRLDEAGAAQQANLLNVLGNQYALTGDAATAGRYFGQARTAYAAADDPLGEANALMNLGLVAEMTGDLATATEQWSEANALARQGGDRVLQLRLVNNIGSSYVDQGRYEEALEQLAEAARLAETVGDPWDATFIAIKRGRALHGLARYAEALPYLQQANTQALALESVPLRGEAVQLLKDVHAQLGQYAQAYTLSLAYDSLAEAYFDEESQRLLQELEAEQKAAEISRLEQEQAVSTAQIQRQWVLIGGVAGLAVLLGGLVWLYGQRSRVQAAQAEQLRALDRAKSRFFANISHELRTPLTLMLSPLDAALNEPGSQANQKHLRVARKSGRQLLHLVEDLLDLSKLEAGALTASATAVRLDTLLRRIVFSFESLAVQRQVQLVYKVDVPDAYAARTDTRKVEQILNNLLSNALKYTAGGGHVTVAGRLEGTTLQLSVADTGRGIPPDELPNIFDRYYQVGDGPAEGGAGIGLALTKRLVDLLGGTIDAASTPGEGSTFTLTLPMPEGEIAAPLPPDERGDGAEVAAESAPGFTPAFVREGKQARLLLVEDNRDMSAYLTDILDPYYAVTCAYDGEEALDLLKQASFDLMTSDVMMPRMDGLALLERVRADDRLRQMPVVMLTARADEADRLEGWRLGVDDYITKPFNADELLARIDNLLRNQQERHAWREAHASDDEEPISAEQVWLQQAEAVVLEHIDQSSFAVTDLAEALETSERQLYRKTKALTGLTPLQFIREIRLLRSQRYLEARAFGTVAEVAYAVGFENPSYFSRLFGKRFGKPPRHYVQA